MARLIDNLPVPVGAALPTQADITPSIWRMVWSNIRVVQDEPVDKSTQAKIRVAFAKLCGWGVIDAKP